jgi:hypothetical protein
MLVIVGDCPAAAIPETTRQIETNPTPLSLRIPIPSRSVLNDYGTSIDDNAGLAEGKGSREMTKVFLVLASTPPASVGAGKTQRPFLIGPWVMAGTHIEDGTRTVDQTNALSAFGAAYGKRSTVRGKISAAGRARIAEAQVSAGQNSRERAVRRRRNGRCRPPRGRRRSQPLNVLGGQRSKRHRRRLPDTRVVSGHT